MSAHGQLWNGARQEDPDGFIKVVLLRELHNGIEADKLFTFKGSQSTACAAMGCNEVSPRFSMDCIEDIDNVFLFLGS